MDFMILVTLIIAIGRPLFLVVKTAFVTPNLPRFGFHPLVNAILFRLQNFNGRGFPATRYTHDN
jgi:hypothetical protein